VRLPCIIAAPDPALASHPALVHDLEHAALLPDPALRPLHLAREARRIEAGLAAGGYAVADEAGLALVRPLPWDSAHFGLPCADLQRLYLEPGADDTRARALLEPALEEARRRGVAFLSARPLAAQTAAVAWLLGPGAMLLADTSLELGVRLPLVAPASPGDATLRGAHDADLPALRAIAATFVENRFHRDPRIPRARATALYERWVEAAARGAHGALVVAELEGEVVGFASWLEADAELGVAVMGLVAVHPARRGRGLVGALVAGCAPRAAGRALVTSTQVTNAAALRAFARSGLHPVGARQILHGWL
jgi:GNAT superfamily N-acetyltransferase